MFVGDNCHFKGLNNFIFMHVVFGRDLFPRTVELTVRLGEIICVSPLDPILIIETYECLGTLFGSQKTSLKKDM